MSTSGWDISDLTDYVRRNPRAITPEISQIIADQKPEKRSKYGNNVFEAEGIIWDSKREYNRYCELRLMQRAGEISNLRRQVPFILQDKQSGIRAITYIADFVYDELGGNLMVVEDVKSEITKKIPGYRIKKKMFLARYGKQYEFREV